MMYLERKRNVAMHNWDDDGVCTRCGLDGAEWHWWKHNTYEGKASDVKMPRCEETLDEETQP